MDKLGTDRPLVDGKPSDDRFVASQHNNQSSTRGRARLSGTQRDEAEPVVDVMDKLTTGNSWTASSQTIEACSYTCRQKRPAWCDCFRVGRRRQKKRLTEQPVGNS
eukprot:scaffold87375_cov18-Prasinocladus_malaysianus.AAC.1